MDKIDCLVIGAGVVGLAVARELALAGREVMVVEQHADIGMETSSRNSEVIHAGLYYPTGSMKARLCVTGRDTLYAYCDERGIPYRRCGKLIVATSETQSVKLAGILAQAHANGCSEVAPLAAHEARRLEPEIHCVAALSSPNTGIIDSHAYMLALQGDAENAGALFAFGSKVTGAILREEGVVVQVSSDSNSNGVRDEIELHAKFVVNCAGLWAPRLARLVQGLDQSATPGAWFAKGNYYSLAGKTPFSRLVYPVPEAGGLGVHLTLDLGGQARFGPDVEWLDDAVTALDYRVDPRRAEKFYREIRAYWPALPDDALQPAYSGVRPKISGPGEPAADFMFANHGSRHYLGLYGIESPGLTASLAIAKHIMTMVGSM
ncbi:NAD(P)/FAD-dependent oxidoreductase [Noviherbaspirillum sp. Root189]|uniref:NAD(P)/FAD-dependent oxidoreductase n=1 Tax=Noviherbaspirillum sp. Root189 TaxID=1736487 RepID=UPI0007102E62|nr:NAD(P)/FAD-dependent oxidoreductase [Noviherbaspirillum sp. Root189]KRB93266.1 FAD-dependent oxidoreductase [Noviherbaspirillum sp. Root189]